VRKYIKAVTYHNVAIRQEDGLYVVELVFDV
jgi:SHS2 domain-containing protein